MVCGVARRVAWSLRCGPWMAMGLILPSSPRLRRGAPPAMALKGGGGDLPAFSELPMSFLMDRGQATAYSLIDANFYQLARFSSLASPHVDDSNSSTDEPDSRKEKMKPPVKTQPTAAPAGGNSGTADLNANGEGKPTVKEESYDEVCQEEEENISDLLEEKQVLLEQKEKVIADLKDKLLRSLADAENISSRARREAESIKVYAIQNFVKDLLDVADNLGRAAATVPESARVGGLSNDSMSILKALLEGVEMTEKQLMQVFKQHGVQKFDPIDQPFNPNQHLALFEVKDASKTSGTVAVVLKSGYMLHDRVIRPAEVGVAKQEPEAGSGHEP